MDTSTTELKIAIAQLQADVTYLRQQSDREVTRIHEEMKRIEKKISDVEAIFSRTAWLVGALFLTALVQFGLNGGFIAGVIGK